MNDNKYQSFTELRYGKKEAFLKMKLTDQIIRPSRSINTNIAEGHGRFTHKEQLNIFVLYPEVHYVKHVTILLKH